MTKRRFDSNGWYEIKANPISKAGVFDYLGIEIGLPGLDPDKIYKVRRSAAELGKKSCIDSFKMIPIVDNHTMIGPNKGSMSAEDKGIGGVTGGEVVFDGEYLRTNVKLFSDTMMRQVDSEKNELSSGYSCDYVLRSGTDFGQAYDVDQINMLGNHIALIKHGRMGKEVKVLDHQIYALDSAELIHMKKTTKQLALAAAIASVATVGNTLAALDQDTLTEDELSTQLSSVMSGLDSALELSGLDKKSIEDGILEQINALDAGDMCGEHGKKKKKKEEYEDMEDPDYKKGMDAITGALEVIATGMTDLGTRMTSLEDNQGTAAMDARMENVDRAAALEAVIHITGPVVHAEMDNPAFYGHLNTKCGIVFSPGSEKLAFDAALPFLPKKDSVTLKVVGLDDAGKTTAASFWNQNEKQA